MNITSKLGLRLTSRAQRLSLQSSNGEEGQTLAEYALILALIAAVVVTVVALLGHNISSIFSSIASSI